jgi:predicted nucleic acid-binding Zn ribbon protein
MPLMRMLQGKNFGPKSIAVLVETLLGRRPFPLGETITMVRARFLWDGEIHRHLQAGWGSICPLCTSEDERASAPERVVGEGCSQPLATPSVDLRVCSDRCAKRWRRRRVRLRRPSVACDGCGKPFRPDRHDPRFCSNACRQSAYRRRQATGEPIKPRDSVDEGTHLDNIAGVLHYAGIPIIAIDRLQPGWPSYGNRYVMAFPRIDKLTPAGAMRESR